VSEVNVAFTFICHPTVDWLARLMWTLCMDYHGTQQSPSLWPAAGMDKSCNMLWTSVPAKVSHCIMLWNVIIAVIVNRY